MALAQCPLCDSHLSPADVSSAGDAASPRHAIQCPCCGRYTIDAAALETLRQWMFEPRRAGRRAAIREHLNTQPEHNRHVDMETLLRVAQLS